MQIALEFMGRWEGFQSHKTKTEIPSSQSSSPLGVSLIGSPWLQVSFRDAFSISSFESSRSSSCPQLAYFTGREKHLQVRVSQSASISATWAQGRNVNSRFPPQTRWVRNIATCSLMSFLGKSKACFQVKLTSPLKTVHSSLLFRQPRREGRWKSFSWCPPPQPPGLSSCSANKSMCVCWRGGGEFSF